MGRISRKIFYTQYFLWSLHCSISLLTSWDIQLCFPIGNFVKMGQPHKADMFDCPQELLESVEVLQYTVEEIQSSYADCEMRNQQLQQQLIEKEKAFDKRIRALNEELSTLRHTKVRIARENIMKGKEEFFKVSFVIICLIFTAAFFVTFVILIIFVIIGHYQ